MKFVLTTDSVNWDLRERANIAKLIKSGELAKAQWQGEPSVRHPVHSWRLVL